MTPRWKEAILTWVGVNVTALALTFTLNLLIAGWPWYAGFLAFNSAMVAGLTWCVMPALTRLFGHWLEAPHGDPTDDHRRPDPAQRQDHHE